MVIGNIDDQLHMKSISSFGDLIILKRYKNLRNVFLQYNTNFLPFNQDENHTIEFEPGKTLFFGPLH